MTLFEYLQMTECDYDTYDTQYDASVTVCHIYEEDDNCNYDKFCNNIMKKVDVVKINADSLVVNWSEFIEKNMDKFIRFAREHWAYDYEDDIDEFVYQWINEIHLYIAGYVSEDFYSILNEFVDGLL
jgi:hypothetical protein